MLTDKPGAAGTRNLSSVEATLTLLLMLINSAIDRLGASWAEGTGRARNGARVFMGCAASDAAFAAVSASLGRSGEKG